MKRTIFIFLAVFAAFLIASAAQAAGTRLQQQVCDSRPISKQVASGLSLVCPHPVFPQVRASEDSGDQQLVGITFQNETTPVGDISSLKFDQNQELQDLTSSGRSGSSASTAAHIIATSTNQPVPSSTIHPPAQATSTPPPTSIPEPGDSDWHPPTNHEHGDAPPQWVLNSAMPIRPFGGEAHPGFKGFLFDDPNCCGDLSQIQQVYVLVHIISAPAARLTQNHSFQQWALDSSGGVSYWQGKLDAGDPNNPGARVGRLVQGGPGPSVISVDQAALDAGVKGEQWYTQTARWAPKISWLIGDANYLFQPPESKDVATWVSLPPPNLGLVREAEFIWFRNDALDRVPFDTVFCATAGGLLADCSVPGALPQFVASTMPVGDQNNDGKVHFIQARSYACPDCKQPN